MLELRAIFLKVRMIFFNLYAKGNLDCRWVKQPRGPWAVMGDVPSLSDMKGISTPSKPNDFFVATKEDSCWPLLQCCHFVELLGDRGGLDI